MSSNNREDARNPSIEVNWDIWNQTWLINKIMRSSEKYGVVSYLTLEPGSMTLVLTILSTTADILGISAFFKSVADYIRNRREKVELPPPKKNQDSAFFEARGHLSIDENVSFPQLISTKRVDSGYEFIFTDEYKRTHHYVIYDDCSYDYSLSLTPWEDYTSDVRRIEE